MLFRTRDDTFHVDDRHRVLASPSVESRFDVKRWLCEDLVEIEKSFSSSARSQGPCSQALDPWRLNPCSEVGDRSFNERRSKAATDEASTIPTGDALIRVPF